MILTVWRKARHSPSRRGPTGPATIAGTPTSSFRPSQPRLVHRRDKALVPTQSQPVAVSVEASVTAGEHLLRLHADLARQRRDLQRWAAEVEDAVQPENDAIDYVPLMDALANASRSLLVADEIERQARAAGDAKVLAGSCAAVRDAIRVLEMRVCTLVASASRTEAPIAV
jgi:hypothetical protein